MTITFYMVWFHYVGFYSVIWVTSLPFPTTPPLPHGIVKCTLDVRFRISPEGHPGTFLPTVLYCEFAHTIFFTYCFSSMHSNEVCKIFFIDHVAMHYDVIDFYKEDSSNATLELGQKKVLCCLPFGKRSQWELCQWCLKIPPTNQTKRWLALPMPLHQPIRRTS